MTKQEFDSLYVHPNIVVHTPTKEQAFELLKFAQSFGYRWISGAQYSTTTTRWEYLRDETCYKIIGGTYCSRDFYILNGYKIVKYRVVGEFSLY